MTEHTPGPWHLFNKNGVIAIMKGRPRPGRRNQEIVQWGGFDASSFPKQNKANARLIATAPDMLAFLRLLDRGLTTGKIGDQTILERGSADEIKMTPMSERVRTLIDKATGG